VTVTFGPVQCGDCGAELTESPYSDPGTLKPCPACGSLARRFGVLMEAQVTIGAVWAIRRAMRRGTEEVVPQAGCGLGSRGRSSLPLLHFGPTSTTHAQRELVLLQHGPFAGDLRIVVGDLCVRLRYGVRGALVLVLLEVPLGMDPVLVVRDPAATW